MDRDKLLATIDQVLQELRAVSCDLHPADLDLYGLPAALDRLASRQQEQDANLRIEVSHPDDVCLETRVARVLYRIAQEALTNVRKHSGAQHACLHLSAADGTITLEVRDDGHGFNVEPVQRQAGLAHPTRPGQGEYAM